MSAMADDGSPAYRRFLSSMVIDYEKWHDGIGYDLPALADMTADERRTIERKLLSTQDLDWRDLEAMAALDTPDTRAALRRLAKGANGELRLAAGGHLADLGESVDEAASVARALRESEADSTDMNRALEMAEEHATPEVLARLLECARAGKDAVHCAALLYYHSGLTDDPFDWDHRPFFLRFGEDGDRAAAYQELLELLRTAPKPIVEK